MLILFFQERHHSLVFKFLVSVSSFGYKLQKTLPKFSGLSQKGNLFANITKNLCRISFVNG